VTTILGIEALNQVPDGGPIEVIEAKKVKPLGWVGTRQFATLPDGREVQITGQLTEWNRGDVVRANEVWIEGITRPPRDTSELRNPTRVIVRARLVESGTYAKLAKRLEVRRKPKAAPKARPVDALAALPFLAGRPEEFRLIGTRGPREDADGQLFDSLSRTAPAPRVTPAVPPAVGAQAILERVAKAGVSLQLVGGRLVATSQAGALSDPVREVLRRSAPLLRAHLAGQPLRCAFDHRDVPPEAVSLAEPDDVPACEKHAGGEA
jgi:hypothetical protein